MPARGSIELLAKLPDSLTEKMNLFSSRSIGSLGTSALVYVWIVGPSNLSMSMASAIVSQATKARVRTVIAPPQGVLKLELPRKFNVIGTPKASIDFNKFKTCPILI